MEVSIETEGDICVVTVRDTRIDAAVALAFKETMRRVIEDTETDVVLNLECVTFIDSSGLGALVATYKLLMPARSFILVGMTPAVMKVFELTRMDTIFRMFPTQKEAIEAVGA